MSEQQGNECRKSISETMCGITEIIGCMSTLSGAALFDRAHVARMTSNGIMVGKEHFTEDAWRGVLHSCEAMEWHLLAPFNATPMVWMLGEKFIGRDTLLSAIASCGGVIGMWRGEQRWAIIVDESKIPGLLDSVSMLALDMAHVAVVAGDAKLSASYARMAWLTATVQTPKIVAILVHALALVGEGERAIAYRGVERRAHGQDFDAAVEVELKALAGRSHE